MRREILKATIAVLVFTVLCGVAYPLVVTGIAQLAFPGQANGSLVKRNGKVVGSRLIGQAATRFCQIRYATCEDGTSVPSLPMRAGAAARNCSIGNDTCVIDGMS